MAFIDAEILKAVLPKPAAGPEGFDVHYDINAGAKINAETSVVETQLNEQSLANARARNEGGSNKELAALHPPKPAPGSALSFIDDKRSKADSMYGNLIEKRGLSSIAERGFSMGPASTARRRDHRTAMAPQTSDKNPLMRIRKRRLLQLRKTFDEIAANKKKSLSLNPETLPQVAKEKLVEEAINLGLSMTPLGPIAEAARLVGGNVRKSLAATAKNNARTPAAAPAPKSAHGAYGKWDGVGALIGGSYIDLAPRLKRT